MQIYIILIYSGSEISNLKPFKTLTIENDIPLSEDEIHRIVYSVVPDLPVPHTIVISG